MSQGLANGVPVVTLPAEFIRGRFALAMYRQMGYTDLVADDVEVSRSLYRYLCRIPCGTIRWCLYIYSMRGGYCLLL